MERRFSAFEYLPFGGGARRCIGMAFAQFEMKLVISRILSSFELALADKRSVRPMRRGLTGELWGGPWRTGLRHFADRPTGSIQARRAADLFWFGLG